MKNEKIFFFIGTEAELIKMFPVMLQLQNRNIGYNIIASGQNDIKKSSVLNELNGGKVDIELSDEKNIKKSVVGLLVWFFSTWSKAQNTIKESFEAEILRQSIMVVHGDTVSTVMGAYLAHQLGMKVAHVEAGLRSHNWFSPFPEEIDRVLTSKTVDIHFAPGTEACKNLQKARGKVVDTTYNTIVDSLAYSQRIPCASQVVNDLAAKSYFVFVMHRQENLANKTLLRNMIDLVIKESKKMHAVIILHKPTEVALQEMKLLDLIKQNPNITDIPRMEYFDFMKLLGQAKFVITDGGSNQEELSYMGKPCLIMRMHTERHDGEGRNVVLYDGKMQLVKNFFTNYEMYMFPTIVPEASPSRIVAETILETQRM